MSINAFKKHSGNKITLSDRSLLCGELKVMGSRPKVIFCVHGTRKCRMQDMLFIVHYIGEQFIVTHPPSTSSSTVLWCCWQKPERMPRRMTACSRFRSSAVAKPHPELAAYTSFATTTDLKMMWTEAAVMPWVLSIRRIWTLCKQEEMTLLTCSCTDRVLVTVTPIIFMTSTLLMLARGAAAGHTVSSLVCEHNFLELGSVKG